MANASEKITEFPGTANHPDPIAAVPSDFLSHDGDPTADLRNRFEALQSAAREARRRQRQAEEERDLLRSHVAELEEKLDSGVQNNPQIKALTRERDVLLDQQSQYGPMISDLKQRLKRTETELREANDARDTAAREMKNLKRQTDEGDKHRAETLRQSESAIRQRDLIKKERDEAIEKAALHNKNFTDAQKALAEARKELAAAKKKGDGELATQLDSLRQARDAMSAQVLKLKQRASDLEDEIAEAGYAREAAEKLARDSQSEIAEIRTVLEASATGTDAQRIEHLEATILELQTQRISAQEAAKTICENEARLSAELTGNEIATEAFTHGGAGHAALIGETNADLAAAQEQIDILAHERDALREEMAQRKAEFEAQLNEQAAELERFAMAINQSESKGPKRGELEGRFEDRRLEMIELNAQLENARREIRDLSAKLAEARLLAQRTKRPSSPRATRRDEGSDAPAEKTDDALSALAALRRGHKAFAADQQQPGVLSEMDSHSRTILGHATKDGHAVLQHASSVLMHLIGDLIEIPDTINQGMVRTLNQGIEFIALLLSDPEIEKRIRLDDTCVYIVDDDASSCATAADALGLVGIRAEQSRNSGNAIVDLSSMKCDLILLDVHLPDLDGFELAEQIRTMDQHLDTPIFFLTGDGSLETRTKSSTRGAVEFLRKPYGIHELALKALKTVVTGQLHPRG